MRARAAGQVSQERILADDDVDNPLDLKKASQKLVTAAYLLQAMPEPSMPEGRNLQCSKLRAPRLVCVR